MGYTPPATAKRHTWGQSSVNPNNLVKTSTSTSAISWGLAVKFLVPFLLPCQLGFLILLAHKGSYVSGYCDLVPSIFAWVAI